MEYILYRVKIRYDDKTEIKPFYFNYICDKCNKPVEEYTWDYVREAISRYMQRNNCSVSSDDILILDARKCHMSYATVYRMIDKPDIINCKHENCEIETKENDTIECEGKIATMDMTNKNNQIYYTKACLVCGDGVRLTEEEEMCLRYGHHIDVKICDKCKQAILHIRKQVEENNK